MTRALHDALRDGESDASWPVPAPCRVRQTESVATTPRGVNAAVASPGKSPVEAPSRGEAEEGKSPPVRHVHMGGNPQHETQQRPNRVLVLGSDGLPLMPCEQGRAQQLIHNGRIEKKWYGPCGLEAIQLKDRRRGDGVTAVQPMEVRCDPGVRYSGFAVVILLPGEDRVVYQGVIEHRTEIVEKNQERGGYRRARRHRSWYRPARFDNRKRAEDWMAPSLFSPYSNQYHRLAKLMGWTGAEAIVVETAKFDLQKVMNTGIKGVEYQRGPLYGWADKRAYVSAQWGNCCAYCGKKAWEHRGERFEAEHVRRKSKGGSNSVRNLVWACRTCNEAKDDTNVREFLNANPKLSREVLKGRPAPLAAAGKMAAITQRLERDLRDAGHQVQTTTGAATAEARRENGIGKSHANDAACCGAHGKVTRLRQPSYMKATGHGSRQQRRGKPDSAYAGHKDLTPSERRKVRAASHAHYPHTVYGIGTGDLIELKEHKTGRWVRGRARVRTARGEISIMTRRGARSTRSKNRVRKMATAGTYRKMTREEQAKAEK